MKKVAEVLLRTFLRRYPLPTRINWFSFLGRYVWLKDVLEELRPVLLPSPRESSDSVAEVVAGKPDATILGILERSEIRGRMGYYAAHTYLGPRGNGHLFSAIEITSKRPVVIKEFLLPLARFTQTEALLRQNRFQQLAGFQLADGRSQDFRVMQPIDAVADSESSELCFLVTEERDRAPTLRQHLQTVGALPLTQVRDVLSQILQTLDFLHRQKFSFSAGAVQNGLVHGNLSLDTVLWIAQSPPFVYLTDLRLWEQCFDPTVPLDRSTQMTPDLVQQDLYAVGEIGKALVQGLDPHLTRAIEPSLAQVLDSLQTAQYDSAETARRHLLQLVPRSPITIAPFAETVASTTASRPLPVLLGLSLLALLVGGWLLLSRWRSTQAKSPPSLVSTCCLSEISAIPSGTFSYTAVEGGTWWRVLQQRDLLRRGQSLTTALTSAQPKLQLQFESTASFDQVLAQVQSGAADFAILPLPDDLPKDLMAQTIAYDGIVAVVAFSYAERQQGLPRALNGQLSLDQVRQLYDAQINQWQNADLPVRRYASDNPEVIAVFEQRVLNRKLQTLVNVQRRSSIELARQILRDFEDREIGSIGVAPLSEILGQCSVYPLALSRTGPAVQSVVLSNDQEIDPETNLCNRKGAYAPAPARFHTGQYPLSYSIAVVYPRDNRRSAIGKKFAELMRTLEGQRLLRSAGLVPLNSTTRPSADNSGGKQ